IDELWEDPTLPRSLRGSVQELRADIAYRAYDYDQCVADRRALYEKSETPDRRRSLSRCLERAEQYEEAIALWEEVANDRSRNRHNRASALWTALTLAMRGAKYDRARELLAKYEKRSRGHVAERRMIRTWIAYRGGEFQDALDGFTTMEARDKGRAAMARYYRGKVSMRLGTPEGTREGVAILRELAADAPFKYYGLQARTLLEHYGEVPPPLPPLQPLAEEAMYLGYGDLLQRLAKLDEAYGDWIPSLARTHQLYRAGFIEEARREFRIAADGMLNTKRRLSGGSVRKPRTDAYNVGAGWQGDWKRWAPSLSTKGRALVRDPEQRASLWAQMREVARGIDEPYRWIKFTSSAAGSRAARWHPRAYRATVEREAAAFMLDPSHLWSLMYTESRFRRFVVSPVGARGAIQIMPVTERRLLEFEHGFSGHVDSDDLFDVEHNVHLASLYMSELLKKFSGQGAFAYA
ncbi:MAG: transglycosylase SLT domain-containing protein, partial [Nannocystaceae bacterium]